MKTLSKYFIKAAKIAAKNGASGHELVHIDEEAMTVTNGSVVFRFPHGLSVSGAGYLNFVKVKTLITKFKTVDTIVFDGGNATFISGKRTVKFVVEDVKDPTIFSVYSQYTSDTPAATATNTIDFGDEWVIAQGFVGKDDLRPAMKGVFIDESNIVATDAHRMCRLPHANKIEKAVVCPPEVFQLLNGNTKVYCFETGDVSEYALADNGVEQVRFVPIKAKYPNYNCVWPNLANSVVQFNTNEVLAALDTCSVAVAKPDNLILILPHEIYAENLDDGMQASHKITQNPIEGGAITFGLNAMFFQHIAGLCGDTFIVKYKNENTGIVIDDRYILMPVLY